MFVPCYKGEEEDCALGVQFIEERKVTWSWLDNSYQSLELGDKYGFHEPQRKSDYCVVVVEGCYRSSSGE